MKTTMKKIVSVLLSFVTVMSISSVTAFATDSREQIEYVNDEERYDFIWKKYLHEQSSELVLSIIRDELKDYISQIGEKYKYNVYYELDYTIGDASRDFNNQLDEKYGIITPYNEKIYTFLKEHPNATLEGTSDSNGKEICYFEGKRIDEYFTDDLDDIYMQYKDGDASNILLWTYDKNSDKYICKNENGKVVNSVAKYHLENETSSSKTASTSSDSSTNSSQTSSMTDNKPDTASYSATTGSPKMESALTASGDDTPTTTESVGPDTQEVVFADDSSNPSTTQIILIVIGVLIIAGIIVIIVMLNKKKKEE